MMFDMNRVRFLDLIHSKISHNEKREIRKNGSMESIIVIKNGFFNNLKNDGNLFNNSHIFNLPLSKLIEEKVCKIVTRRNMEFFCDFPEYRQLNVCAFIHNDTSMVLLKPFRHGPSVHGSVTLVQGHVAFFEYMLPMTLKEIFISNLIKEVREETIGIIEDIRQIKTDKVFYLDINSYPICYKHIGILFELNVGSYITKINSNEKYKHAVICKNIKYIHEVLMESDQWVWKAIELHKEFFNTVFE